MYNLITVGDVVMDTHVDLNEATVECNLDGRNCRLCLDYADKIPIADSFQALGGNVANVAAGGQKLGLKTAIISTIGEDSNAKIIMEELQRLKIDTDFIATDSKVKTRYSIILNFQGEKTVLSYHQKRKYAWPKNLPSPDWFYYSSLSDGFEDLQEKIINYLAKHRTVRLAYNPGSFQLKNNPDRVREIIALADVVILNLEEAEKVLDTTLKKEKNITAFIHKLLSLGAKEAAITNAAEGAWAGNIDEVWQMKGLPVKVASKTGAGDAFSSGYLSAKILGHDIEEALRWGIYNSSGVIQEHGAQNGLLDTAGIKKISAKFPDIRPVKIF